MFNDSTNEYISFIMKTDVEMIDRYLDSFKDIDSNNASLVKLKANKSYGIGLDFGAGKYIDLSNQKFNIQIQSAISSSDPYVMFCYFHSILKVWKYEEKLNRFFAVLKSKKRDRNQVSRSLDPSSWETTIR